MLAQLATNAGFLPIVVDCYADEDTRGLAFDWMQVTSLAIGDIHLAIEALSRTHALTHFIYGSGFEHAPDSLQYLQARFTVLGNSAALFARLQDKADFFNTLRALNIPFPKTIFHPPTNAEGWLIKPVQGVGGEGVFRADSASLERTDGVYWQRYQAGELYSVLFTGYEYWAAIVGFNRQWALNQPEQEFLFAGICSQAVLSERSRDLLRHWLRCLMQVYPLRGMGSLDFIVDQDACYLLEINPRIPASAQLYGHGILELHLQSCLGHASKLNAPEMPCAYQIMYAGQPLQIPYALQWPEWVFDRPMSGALIGKGQPVCSIIATHIEAANIENQLARQQQTLEFLLNTGFYTHAIPG